MRRRSRIAIATVATVWSCPALAMAAEGPEDQGAWWPLIFYAINFGVFVWIVVRFGGPPIVGFFRGRAKTIRENLSRTDRALHDAEALARQATELTAGLEQEKTRLQAEMAAETAYQVKRLDELAREAVERIERDRQTSVAAARESGQRRLREALASAAGNLAREIVRRDFRPGDQIRLLDGFVSRLGEEARR
jgi:F0F1-type ATP synthase membrane subunit b/b'